MSTKDLFIKAAAMAVYAKAFEKLGDFYNADLARRLAIYYTAEGMRSLATLSVEQKDAVKETS